MISRNDVLKKNMLLNKAIILFIMTVSAIVLSACDDFSFYTELDGAQGLRITAPDGSDADTLVITPYSAVLPIGTSYKFDATGGLSPYTFSIVSGTGDIEPETGLYTAPSAPGNAVVAVIDSVGQTDEAEINIVSVSEFTAAPASISLYTYNTFTFSVLGGIAPFNWSMVSGGGTIDGTTGKYTAPGSESTDIVKVSDSVGNTSNSVITVLKPFSINPSSVQVSVNNTYTLTAEGGKSPYVFSLDSGDGTVDPDTGEYTAPGTAGNAVVGVTDILGNYDSADITITLPAALLISPTTLTLNVNGSDTFFATGGTSPYSFSILSGTGSIDSVTGLYTAPGSTGTDIIRLSDNDGAVSDAVVTIVSAGALSITPAAAVVEQNALHSFSADGGSPPYIYSVSSGLGTINPSTGLYTAPSTTGAAVIRVVDALGSWVESSVDIAPAAPSELVADGTVANPDTITLSWTDNATGEDGFIIERKESGGAFAFLDTVAADTTVYPEEGLLPNVLYGYRVKAYWGAIESDYSNESYDLPNS